MTMAQVLKLDIKGMLSYGTYCVKLNRSNWLLDGTPGGLRWRGPGAPALRRGHGPGQARRAQESAEDGHGHLGCSERMKKWPKK